MHYVVAGVGYTGRRVLDALPPAHALGLSRSPHKPGAPPTTLLDLDLPRQQLPGKAELLACLTPFTLLYTIPPPAEGNDDPRLALFLDMLGGPPKRIVYLSTSGVYGDRKGRLTDESAPTAATTDRAKRRLAAEARLGAWCEENAVERTVLRVPGIYGPGRLSLERLQGGAAVLRDADSGPGNRIHVDDLKRCCLAAMQAAEPAGICNVGDGDTRSSGRFSKTVARLAGLPAPREISLAEARREWSAARLSFIEESRQLDLTRMTEVLGVTPRYANAEDGIRASLDEEGAAKTP